MKPLGELQLRGGGGNPGRLPRGGDPELSLGRTDLETLRTLDGSEFHLQVDI